jgi:MoaA/NifB/PqqE/SkfB family radical SAM enzyme
MKVQTFSALAGNAVCNAKCPFCVSKMTPSCGVSTKKVDINWRNFEIACRVAEKSGVQTLFITGKGEPTLFPDHITQYIARGSKYFPFIELQTHGMQLPDLHLKQKGYISTLQKWYNLGLTLICISCVHHDLEKNRKNYSKDYQSLPYLVKILHDIGFSVRLSCVGIHNHIDRIDELLKFLELAKKWKVDQFTWRPVSNDINEEDLLWNDWPNEQYNEVPKDLQTKRDVFKDTNDLLVREQDVDAIRNYFDLNTKTVLELMHGAKVYSYKGQNVSINSCLTNSPDPEEIRQLIFFPDGSLRHSWTEEGAVLL